MNFYAEIDKIMKFNFQPQSTKNWYPAFRFNQSPTTEAF